MRKYIAILYILTSFQYGWAGCPEDIQVLSKGDIANCDGILFSPEASKKADDAISDDKYNKALIEKLTKRNEYTDKEINILDQRLKLYIDESQILASEVSRKEHDDKWQKMGYFFLGVLATGISIYGAKQIAR